VDIPSNGEYTFVLQEDGGGHLWIHDAHVISDDFNHTPTEHPGSLYLQAGMHPIRVIYRHQSGPANLILNSYGPGIPALGPIPAKALFHDE